MAKCPKARKWKRRYKDAVSARRVDQAKAFERASKLEGQLRAIDHILIERELPGPSQDEWVAQARQLLLDLVNTRLERREAGYSQRDIENMRHQYHEHFAYPVIAAVGQALDERAFEATLTVAPDPGVLDHTLEQGPNAT